MAPSSENTRSKLRAEEFNGNIVGHSAKLVSRAFGVNLYALSLKSSRPISIRLISLVPAPIS